MTNNEKLHAKFILTLWGNTLYLDYKYLADFVPFANLKQIEIDIKSLVTSVDNGEDYRKIFEDDIEWFVEGASIDGKLSFGKNFVDYALKLNEISVPVDTIVYRTTNWKNSDPEYDSWVSVSLNENGPYFGEQKSFLLKKGTKIISTTIDGKEYCDEDELIVKFQTLMQSNPVTNNTNNPVTTNTTPINTTPINIKTINKELFDSKFIEYLLQPDFVLNLVQDENFQRYFHDRFEANYDVMGKQIKRKSIATVMAVKEAVTSNFEEFLILDADKNSDKQTIKELLDENNFIKSTYGQLLNEYCKKLVPKLTQHKIIQEIIEEVSIRRLN